MNTFAKTNQSGYARQTEKVKTEKVISPFWKNAEDNRLGITPLVLLVIAIVGGIAAATGIMDSWVKLAVVAFPSAISLALILSVAPMRAIYVSAVVAIVLDLLIILF